MAQVIKKRLQVQPIRGATIDRSLTFVVGTLPEGERRKLRGVIFEVATKVEALRMFRDLHKTAKEAVTDGKVGEFLDALDERAHTDFDAGPRFKEFAEQWFETSVTGGGLRESQVESDRSILDNHLLPAFGSKSLRDITARDIDRFKAAKRKEHHQFGEGYSPKTINNHLAVLHRVFNKAIEYGIVEKNPVGKTAWMRSDKTAEEGREWWTPDEEAKAIAILMGWRDRDPLAYLALTAQIVVGMRFSELRALEKRDLDLQVPGLWIRRAIARKQVSTPKNKKARFHVIPRDLAEELRRWMLRTDGQQLFPDPRGDRPLSNKILNRWYRELAAEAGVRRITSHGARHTVGSSYAVMGAGQKAIAELLGHADTHATERYTHLARNATASLVEARWARLRGEQGGAP
ncbi:MAG: site-specific integrase [Pseudomonadota bacterium]